MVGQFSCCPLGWAFESYAFGGDLSVDFFLLFWFLDLAVVLKRCLFL